MCVCVRTQDVTLTGLEASEEADSREEPEHGDGQNDGQTACPSSGDSTDPESKVMTSQTGEANLQKQFLSVAQRFIADTCDFAALCRQRSRTAAARKLREQ